MFEYSERKSQMFLRLKLGYLSHTHHDQKDSHPSGENDSNFLIDYCDDKLILILSLKTTD